MGSSGGVERERSRGSAGGTAHLRLLAEAGLLAVVAVGVLLDSRSYPGSLAEGAPGPAFFPRLLALLLMGCAAWLAVRVAQPSPDFDAIRSRGNAASGSGAGRGARLGLGAAWIAAFLLAWPRVGTIVSTPLLVAGLMWLTGERSPLALISIPIAFAAFIYLVFMVALGVPLPAGF